MRVNLPCLMGSCPNFLRPTCSYTECLPSLSNRVVPYGVNYRKLQLLFVVWFLLTLWFCKVRFPADAYPASLNQSFRYDHVPWIWVNGFLSRTLLNFRSFWTSAGFWNTALLYTSYAARLSCLDFRRISFNIFWGSYLIPFFKIVKIILRSFAGDCY